MMQIQMLVYMVI